MNGHRSIGLEEGQVIALWPVLAFEVSRQPLPVVCQRANNRHLVRLQQVLGELDRGVQPE